MNNRNTEGSLGVVVDKVNDLFLLARIFSLICLLPLLFRVMKLQSLLKLLTPRNTRSSVDPDQKEKIIRWTDAILGWDFFIFRTSCLKRSLVLYHFLKQAGLPLQINFGVRKLAPASRSHWPLLDGHGWLSLRGQTYLEGDEPRKAFRLIYSFPPLP
jgi:hypothetical protein